MPTPATPQPETAVPLCVDLDGTLIRTDLLWETLLGLVQRNPATIFQLLFWWTRGRACLKQKLAERVTIDPATLPYHEEFLAWLREQKKSGRKLILATASDLKAAQPVAAHVGLFDEVLASDGKTNLRSENKLRLLTEKFGERGFDYAGNSSADFAVWRGARQAIVVNARKSVAARAATCTTVGRVFPRESSIFAELLRSLRPHQWVKNLIVFVPVLAAHQLADVVTMQRTAWAFVVFCLCASGVYVLNDLMDLDADRRHPTKRNRPFAAGELPIPAGLALGLGFMLAGLLAAMQLSWQFTGVAAAYLILSTSYSWRIKSIALLDVFFLAGLYTIRLVAGHAATNLEYSSWMLMFSIFIFLSLALVKRYVELYNSQDGDPKKPLGGRGYAAGDLEIVASLGTGSGYLAALVLALYVDSQKVITLYAHPNWLLILCPLLLYWISHVWLRAHRGQMPGDPVLFAVKDGVSYFIGALALAVMWLATGH